MLRDIRNLAAQYVREHWMRDLMVLVAFAAVVAMRYISIDPGSVVYAARLGNMIERARNMCVYLWVGTAVVYSLCTLFGGYGDVRRCYASLLLPAGTGAKFAWETARTLLVFPAVALGVLYAFDACYMYFITTRFPDAVKLLVSLTPVGGCVTAAAEPLNYIPVALYALVWMHSVAVLARSGMNRIAAVAMVLAALFVSGVYGMRHYPFVAMDYADYGAVQWRSRVSWCPVTTGYALSYIWYGAMPAALYVAAYFKFKERKL